MMKKKEKNGLYPLLLVCLLLLLALGVALLVAGITRGPWFLMGTATL